MFLQGETTSLYQQTVVDAASSTVTYIGNSKVGVPTSNPSWQIQKIVVSGNTTTIYYPQRNGIPDPGFWFTWDDRASYTYSLS